MFYFVIIFFIQPTLIVKFPTFNHIIKMCIVQKQKVVYYYMDKNRIYNIDSMDNYDVLLEQFLVHQQEQTCTHEQFTSVIDEIRNQKQSKKFMLSRKKQEKSKLLNKALKCQQSKNCPQSKNTQIFQMCEQELNLEQINNAMLKKQCDQLQKQFNKLHKAVKEMQQQVSVYSRKDNQIKQLKYSSKRQLQTVLLQVKTQKTINIQLQQKHQKVLEQLQDQKSIIQQENRYFANQLQDLKIFHKNFNKNGSYVMSMEFAENSNDRFMEIEEIYSKKKVEEYLRYFYFIARLKENWFKSDLCPSIEEVRMQVNKNIEVGQYFHFLSKNQIFSYYLQKLGQKSIFSIVMVVLQLYRSITKNIANLENNNNHLNNKIVQLKQQYEVLCETHGKAERQRLKSTTFMISQCQKGILNQKQNIKHSSTSIFKYLEHFFQIYDKLKRLINTVDFVSESKCQMSMIQINSKPSLLHKTSKRMEISPIDKRISGNITSSKNLNIMDSQALKSVTSLALRPKKSAHHSHPNNKFDTSKYDEKLGEYEFILKRNPRQMVCRWNEVIKNQEGFRFLQNIFQNDLFRVFLQPGDYNPEATDLQNQIKCTNKIYESLRVLLKCLKQSIGQRLSNIIFVNRELQNNKTKQLGDLNDVGAQQARLVIQSKGYFRRDNFKLLEKIELMEMKKKGLYIPFRYGIDVEEQMIANKTVVKESKIQGLDRSRMFTSRKFRYTSPLNPNYISSYRERLNKADRKIRDLLKNIDVLRVQNKLNNKQGRQSRRLSTRVGETSVLLS